MHKNLIHVLEGNCDDPDCEIHNIMVGCEGGTISEHDLAMWFAGAQFQIHNPSEAGLMLARCLEKMPQRTLETDLLEDR